jgi:ribosomal protein L37AE/L43A
MMRILPPCPRCQEDELRLSRAGNQLWMHCYECGWKSGIVTVADDQTIDDAIAAAVAKAKEEPNSYLGTVEWKGWKVDLHSGEDDDD